MDLAKQFGKLYAPPETGGGGFTMDMKTGEAPKSGYMVGTQGHEESTPASMLHPHQMGAYVAKHQAALSQPNAAFGGWNNTDDGQVYLDVSHRHPSGGPMELAKASQAMIGSNQIAMHHLDTKTDIPNHYYGQSPAEAGESIKRHYFKARGPV